MSRCYSCCRNLALLTLSIVLLSCDKEDSGSEVLDFDTVLVAHKAQQWSLTSFHNGLSGNWEFKKSVCCSLHPDCSVEEKDNLFYEFSNTKISVVQKGITLSEVDYTLVQMNNGFKIQTVSPLEYVAGEVFMSADHLVFYLSPLDGCDNYFIRN